MDTTANITMEQQVAQLETTVAMLLERLDAVESPASELTESATSATSSSVRPAPQSPDSSDSTPVEGSRRNLLKLAAGAAAGGTALALAKTSGPVAAADDSALTVGTFNVQGDAGTRSTSLIYENAAAPSSFLGPRNIMTVRDTNPIPLGFDDNTAYPAAVGGWANRVLDHGVYGRTSRPDGYGVVAHGTTVGLGGPATTGLLARGTRSNIELDNRGDAPAARTDVHNRGEIIADESGALWYCVAAGSPGTWTKLADTSTAGAFHPVTPFRVYDSRRIPGEPLSTATFDETISVKDARDPETYAVTTADATPAGATAVSANVAVINTSGNGFLSVNPGGDSTIGASAVNWFAGARLGNAGIFSLNDNRELQIIAGGNSTFELLVDITGYWL
jgi:hypothetical protein